MKKLSVFLIFLALGISAFSRETKAGSMAAGFGPEWNMNSRHNFAGGIALGFDYNLPNYLALGLTATGSSNFINFKVIEGTVLFRYYFQKTAYAGFFGQLDAGAFIIFEDDELIPMPEIGLRLGYRQPLLSSFYIEPYGRLGYPFAFGIGFLAGVLF